MRAQTPHDPEDEGFGSRPELPSGDAQVRAPSADLERLAKAARDYEWDGAAPQQEWDSDKHYWIASVRAVLTAAREPSDVMLIAGFREMHNVQSPNGTLDGIWKAMLDAILSDGSEATKTGDTGTPK